MVEKGEYKNNKKNGSWRQIYPDKNLTIQVETYKEELNGFFGSYINFVNNKYTVYEEGEFLFGKKNNEWIKYNHIRIIEYKENIIMGN